jgi:hypothetical protein
LQCVFPPAATRARQRGRTHGRGYAGTARGILRAVLPAQQEVRQLGGDIRRDPRWL